MARTSAPDYLTGASLWDQQASAREFDYLLPGQDQDALQSEDFAFGIAEVPAGYLLHPIEAATADGTVSGSFEASDSMPAKGTTWSNQEVALVAGLRLHGQAMPGSFAILTL